MSAIARIGRFSRWLAMALVGLAATGGGSRAGTIYSASMDMTLKYQGYYDADGNLIAGTPDGVTLQGSIDSAPFLDKYTLGNGTASATADGSILGSDPLALNAGDGIQVVTSVSGTTTDPGDASIALALHTGYIAITNDGTTDAKLAFSLEYTSTASAETSDPAVPAYGWTLGVVGTASNLPDFPDFTDPLDPSIFPLPFPFYLNLADTTFRPGSFPDSGTFALDVTIFAGGSDEVWIGNASHGDPFGVQAVPEPGTFAMAGAGLLLGLVTLGRRRHILR